MPSTLKLECASCGESSSVLSPGPVETLAHWVWQQMGTPRLVIHKDADGSVKKIGVVPIGERPESC